MPDIRLTSTNGTSPSIVLDVNGRIPYGLSGFRESSENTDPASGSETGGGDGAYRM
jgi:hypothetical protein